MPTFDKTISAPDPLQKTPMSARRTSMIGAMLTMLGPFSLSIYTPAMPALAEAFGTTDAAIKLSLSAYFGGFAFAILVAGPISDAFGRRRAVLGFLMIYLAGSVLATFATDVNLLLLGRLIQGIGASVGMSVGRVIVRDQFTGEPAARILNLIGMMLATGPAIAPTFGGIILDLFGWQATFYTMTAFGLVVCAAVFLSMAETGKPDRRKIHPVPLLATYGRIITSQHFLAASLLIAASAGSIYALASMLPFVLIDIAGLTPAQFGLGMLAQTGSYFVGSSLFRLGMRWTQSRILLRIGVGFVALGALAMLVSVETLAISYLSIMVPVGTIAFGMAFIMPYAINAALLPFPDIAGSASAMMGFLQMGAGFLGGLAAAALGAPVLALTVVVQAMGVIAVLSFVWLRFAETEARG